MNIDDADRHTDCVAGLPMTAHFAATAILQLKICITIHLPYDIWLNESSRITRLQPLDSFASEISPPISQYTAVDEVHAHERGSIIKHRVDIYLNTLKSWLIQADVAIYDYRSGEYKIPMYHDQAASQQDKIQFASKVTLCPHLSNILGRATLWVRERAEIMRGLLLALFVHKMDLQDPSIITGGWKGRTTIAQSAVGEWACTIYLFPTSILQSNVHWSEITLFQPMLTLLPGLLIRPQLSCQRHSIALLLSSPHLPHQPMQFCTRMMPLPPLQLEQAQHREAFLRLHHYHHQWQQNSISP